MTAKKRLADGVEVFLDALAQMFVEACAAAVQRKGSRAGRQVFNGVGRHLDMACRVPGCKEKSGGPRNRFMCKEHQALTKTVLYVLVLPLVAAVCLCALWPVLAVVKNVIFINYARDQLRRRFRLVATERFAMTAQTEGASALLPPRPYDLPPVLPRQTI